MTLTNSNVSGSSAGSGGGVCVESNDHSYKPGTTLTLSNNIISNNSASDGGGICVFGIGTITLSNNTIINNSTINEEASGLGSGGGIYLSGSKIFLTNNTVKNNIANGFSNGGIYSVGSGLVGGGGIYVDSYWTAVLDNNTISDNSARSGSGGVFVAAGGSVTFTNNIVSDNIADISGDLINGGGGAYFYGSGSTSTIHVTNNTFTGNTAHNDGGGLMVTLREETAVANIYNNILWNNSANESADIYLNNDGDADFLPSPVNLFNNMFDKSSTGINIQRPFTIDDSNLDKINPMFIGNGDYHLKEGSPCIDKGLNNAPSIPDKDFDDDQRIIDGDNDGRKIVDIGADEYFSDGVGRVLISGIIKYAGNPVCAMVLANGQYMFTCKAGDDFGKYELAVPLDDNEEISIQAFVSGMAPFRQTTNESDLDIDIDMQKADPESRLPSITTVTTTDASIQTGWSRITGTVDYDGSPLCAMVLANGQYIFSCGAKNGTYDLTVPLDANGQITLYVFASGFQPYKHLFTP
jgi:parallel beta-helix repeat protein